MTEPLVDSSAADSDSTMSGIERAESALPAREAVETEAVETAATSSEATPPRESPVADARPGEPERALDRNAPVPDEPASVETSTTDSEESSSEGARVAEPAPAGTTRSGPATGEPRSSPPSPPPTQPDAPETDAEKRPSDDATDLPGEVIEEITIEAPPVLWDAFEETPDAESGEVDADDPATAERGGRRAPVPSGPEAEAGGRRPLRSLHRGPGVRMVELPQPKPFKTASLSLLTILLALLLVWQVKAFYLDDLAQVPVLRPYLEALCRPLGCELPPRSDFSRIALAGTTIDVNPARPGALEIKASLVNRAHFSQPYPWLRVTLTDREGRVVGRRTYLPGEYLANGGDALLPSGEMRNVSINLAQPAEDAVGYEVELMPRISDGDG
ncbi:MAG TPA: DUF3426 domain-containing protein [Arenicellales bacterium]|nr:DUF3426 domain-containing protein [Arenicellales bacterium]